MSVSRSKGLYGGLSVDGAVVATRGALNAAYYAKDVSTQDVLIRAPSAIPTRLRSSS